MKYFINQQHTQAAIAPPPPTTRLPNGSNATATPSEPAGYPPKDPPKDRKPLLLRQLPRRMSGSEYHVDILLPVRSQGPQYGFLDNLNPCDITTIPKRTLQGKGVIERRNVLHAHSAIRTDEPVGIISALQRKHISPRLPASDPLVIAAPQAGQVAPCITPFSSVTCYSLVIPHSGQSGGQGIPPVRYPAVRTGWRVAHWCRRTGYQSFCQRSMGQPYSCARSLAASNLFHLSAFNPPITPTVK